MWTRDGNLDSTHGICFEPNHFVLVIYETEIVCTTEIPIGIAETNKNTCTFDMSDVLINEDTVDSLQEDVELECSQNSLNENTKKNADTAALHVTPTYLILVILLDSYLQMS